MDSTAASVLPFVYWIALLALPIILVIGASVIRSRRIKDELENPPTDQLGSASFDSNPAEGPRKDQIQSQPSSEAAEKGKEERKVS